MTPVAVLLAVHGANKVLWPGGLNTRFYLDLNSFSRRTAWAHGFMHDYALWLGVVLLAACFLCASVVSWWRRDPHAVALLGLGGIGTLVALALNQVVGHAARELRPYDIHHHVLVLVARANDYAFPSDHAVVAGALLMSIVLVIRRAAPEEWWESFGTRRWLDTASGESLGATGAMVTLSAVGAVLALFLCFARVYVGAHYPGDVVAGLLLGFVVVLVVSLARPLAYWTVDAICASPLACVVRRPLRQEREARAGVPGAETPGVRGVVRPDPESGASRS